MCGNIDDCGPDACRNENCVDEVKRFPVRIATMLQVNGSVCVAKECENLLSNTVQWNRRESEHESVTVPSEEVRCDRCYSSRLIPTTRVLSRGVCWE